MRTRALLAADLVDALREQGLDQAEALLGLGDDTDGGSLVTTVEIPIAGTGGRFHLKRYRYPGWRKARHLLGRGTLGGTPPELNEFRVLEGMGDLGVPTVRPVAAAAAWHGPRLLAHMLLTEHVQDAVDLAARLDDASDPLNHDPALLQRVLDRVATALARMHEGGLVHRDVHARNILVRIDPEPAVALLDCRRGGPPTRRRPAIRDLATLRLDLETRVPEAAWVDLVRVYRGGDGGLEALLARICRERDALARRLQRRGRPLRR